MHNLEIIHPLNRETCASILEQAVRNYPNDITPEVKSRYLEFFVANSELTCSNLTSVNKAYALFRQSSYHPQLYVKENATPFSVSELGVLVAFMGPSSSGKDAILDLSNLPFSWVQTTTTRPKAERDKPRGGRDRYEHVGLEEFQRRIQNDEFIEWVPQFKHLYGTMTRAVEEILDDRDNSLKVWRGEIFGVGQMGRWIEDNHDDLGFLSCFVLPEMRIGSFCDWMKKSRGVETTIENRFPKALWEMYMAAGKADVIIQNPIPDPSGEKAPVLAAEAINLFFEKLVG